MDVVAGSCAVLHGLIAAYGLVRFLLSVGRTVSVLGPRVFFSLGMVETLISLGASACILMAGIGLLTGERKKALEFGVPASGIYLALVAYRMLALLRISSLLGSPFTARVFGNMIPLMLLSTVGPVLLIYVSRQKAR